MHCAWHDILYSPAGPQLASGFWQENFPSLGLGGADGRPGFGAGVVVVGTTDLGTSLPACDQGAGVKRVVPLPGGMPG